MKLYALNNSPACLFSDGSVLNNQIIRFKFDINDSFHLQLDENEGKMYFLNSGMLQVADIDQLTAPVTILKDVLSFILYRNYLIYIIKDLLIISDLKNNENFTGYSDENTELICVRDNKIILYTRFGTLETLTNKLFSKVLIRDAIKSKNYLQAAKLCEENHVDFSIFLESGGFNMKNLCDFSDSHAFSLFQAMNVKSKSYYLENEYLERLDVGFDPNIVLKNSGVDEKRLNFISMSSLTHIFKDFDQIPLKVNYEYLKKNLNSERVFVIENDDSIAESVITTDSTPFEIINAFLKNMSLERHFSAIINIFIDTGRVDLCFYMENLPKVVKILLTKLSPESISKESIKTLNIDKILSIHRLCQRDSSPFLAFYNSCTDAEFSLSDYLEDRKSALFYLTKSKINEYENYLKIHQNDDDLSKKDEILQSLLEYAAKFELIDTLIMYTYYNVFDFCFYPLVTRFKSLLEQFYLFLNSDDEVNAMKIAKENIFWSEALKIDASEANCKIFIDLLIENSRFSEAGQIFYDYLSDFTNSITFFIKGRNVAKAFAVFNSDIKSKMDLKSINSMEMLIRKSSVGFLKNDLIVLEELKQSFEKYKERLDKVRDRLNENMNDSQTSFSYTSFRSSEKALIKDRPGGIYENEFVMNKIKTIVLNIVDLRSNMEALLDIFRFFNENEYIEAFNNAFDPLKRSLRSSVEEIWAYVRTDCEIEKPDVPKPELSFYFD